MRHNAVAFALVREPTGRLVAAGTGFALVRYKPDGLLDRRSGRRGIATASAGAFATAYALVRRPDGTLVSGGEGVYGGFDRFDLVAYTPTGSLNRAFGSDGKLTTALKDHAGATAVVRQPDGKLVAAGWANDGTNTDFALARYLP